MCSFSIAFWGCLDLFYFHLRFIKNFQIIWEEFPFFSQFFTIHLNCCVCLPPGFLTLWLYLPSCRFAHGYCRGLALCMFAILLLFPLGCCRGLALCMLVILLRFPLGCCRGLALCVLVILLRFPLGCCLGLALCVLVICVCFARSPPGSLGFARSLRGFAQG